MDYLEEKTGRPRAYWVARIEALIREQSTAPAKETSYDEQGNLVAVQGHGGTDTRVVLERLLHEVLATFPVSGPVTGIPAYDENMRAASLLGLILALWYASVHKAKCFDSHRPVATRRSAYQGHMLWVREMIDIVTDHASLSTYFQQPWDYPFSPDAKNGGFV